MATHNTATALKSAARSQHSNPDAAALMKSLTALTELSAGHLQMNEMTLERCRVAAEWRQAVDEQGAVLLRSIRFRMTDLIAQTLKVADDTDSADRERLTREQIETCALFEKHSVPLREQIAGLVLAHQDLQSCIGKLAKMLVEIETKSAEVMTHSENIKSNELVRTVVLRHTES